MPPPTLEKEVGAASDPPGRRCARGLGQPAAHVNGYRRRSPSPSLSQHSFARQLRWPRGLVRVDRALRPSQWTWLRHNLGRAL